MDPNLQTIEDVSAEVTRMVESVGKDLEPDEDWSPVMFCFSKQGKGTVVGMPTLAHPKFKEMHAKQVIPLVIQKSNPEFVALVTMGWSVQYDTSTIEGRAEQARDEATFDPGDIANRPGRFEVLTAFIVGRNGDETQLLAYVHRYPTSAPVLQWYGEKADRIEGRFPDALRAGFAALKTGKKIKTPKGWGVDWMGDKPTWE